MISNQRLLIIEGADKNWKTTIAKHLCNTFKLPYFKHGGEKQSHLTNGGKGTYFQNLLQWSQPFFVDFLKQTRTSALFDRTYPSEWVYSEIFERPFDTEQFQRVDRQWADMGAVMIVLYRSDLSKLDDREEFAHIEENLAAINEAYIEFAVNRRSECFMLRYDVSAYEGSFQLAQLIVNDLMEIGF